MEENKESRLTRVNPTYRGICPVSREWVEGYGYEDGKVLVTKDLDLSKGKEIVYSTLSRKVGAIWTGDRFIGYAGHSKLPMLVNLVLDPNDDPMFVCEDTGIKFPLEEVRVTDTRGSVHDNMRRASYGRF